MDKQDNLLVQALDLYDTYKYNLIPIGIDKKPLVEWKPYQDTFASREQIIEWFSKPNTNVGIVTGKISNLTVIDIDPRHNGSDKTFSEIKTVKAASGGGGWHYYFKYQEGVKSSASLQQGIDIRSDGGYIIAPPSLHQSGKRYEWVNSPHNITTAELPEFVKEWISKPNDSLKKPESNWKINVLDGVSEGERNTAAISVAGKLFKRFPQEEWEGEVWTWLRNWNLLNKPPLSENELKQVFYSAKKYALEDLSEEKDQQKRSLVEKLIDLTLETTEIYLDESNQPYLSFLGRSIVGYPVTSNEYKRWLAGSYWAENEKGFSGNVFLQVVNSLEGKAFCDDDHRQLFNRIARVDNILYYDLGDDSNVVKITEEGWEITNGCPVKFKRLLHQKPQVHPQRGGDINDVLKYFNLKSETDKLLLLTYLIAIIVPNIPRVVLINVGDQGSAKTTALRVIRSLIDPSKPDLLSPPSDLNELAQAANHHYCLYLDNVSYLKDDMSDTLCRLATGIGFSKRKLYSNDEDILFNQVTSVGITGINLVAQKADLLDRCLILSYERITESMRLDEEEFWRNFEKDKPYILGSIFDHLSAILKALPTFKLNSKPRMADYAKYGALAAVALGKTTEEFLDAFNANIARQNQAAIESSPTAQVILQFMEHKNVWNGSSSDLFKELDTLVSNFNLQRGGSNGFPKSSTWLWRKIMQIRPNLLALGLSVSKEEISSNSIITISRFSDTDPEESTDGDMAAVAANNAELEKKVISDLDENEKLALVKEVFGDDAKWEEEEAPSEIE